MSLIGAPGQGPGEKAVGVKCMLCKHEDLSLDPCHPWKKLEVAVCTCDLSARDRQILRIHWTARLVNQRTPGSVREPVLKAKVESAGPSGMPLPKPALFS